MEKESIQITPELVLRAYAAGLFPMADSAAADELHWFDPEQRGILPLDNFHLSKRLKKTLRQEPYRITFDKCFSDVMKQCADAREDTWINAEIISLYAQLHDEGYAHSVEAWQGGELVGGLYGIAINGAFFGESMFSVATDASKIALIYLVARLKRQAFTLLDAQFFNPHLVQFGMVEIPRQEYHQRLKIALDQDVSYSSSLLLRGDVSDENSCPFSDVTLVLQSIIQTS